MKGVLHVMYVVNMQEKVLKSLGVGVHIINYHIKGRSSQEFLFVTKRFKFLPNFCDQNNINAVFWIMAARFIDQMLSVSSNTHTHKESMSLSFWLTGVPPASSGGCPSPTWGARCRGITFQQGCASDRCSSRRLPLSPPPSPLQDRGSWVPLTHA